MGFPLTEGYIDLTVHRRAFDIAMSGVRGTLSSVTNMFHTLHRTARRALFVGTTYATLSTKAFGSFDKSMRQATAAMGVNEAEFRALTDMVRLQSIKLNIDAREAAEGVKQLGYAGLTAAQTMKVFPDLLEFTKAGIADMGSVTKSTLDIMGAYEIEMKRINEVTDLLLKAWTSSRQELGEMSSAMSMTGATAATSNVKLTELLTVLWALAEAGIRGTRAGTTIRRILLNLKAPTTAMRQELEKLGVSVYTAEGKLRPFMEVFVDLATALTKATEQQKNHAMRVLFGLRAVEGATIVWRKSGDELRKYTASLDEAGGTVDRVLNFQMVGFGERMGRIWQVIKDTSRVVGELLSPAVLQMGEDFGDTLTRITGFLETHKRDIQEWGELLYSRIVYIKDVLFEFAMWFKDDWKNAMKWALDAFLGELKVFAHGVMKIFEKLTIDLYNNIGVWIKRARSVRKYEKGLFAMYAGMEQRELARRGVRTHEAGGYETEEYSAAMQRARTRAQRETVSALWGGEFSRMHPSVAGVPWKEVFADIANKHKEVMTPIFERMPKMQREALLEAYERKEERDAEIIEHYEQMRLQDQQETNAELLDEQKKRAGAGEGIEAEEVGKKRTVGFAAFREAWADVAKQIVGADSPEQKQVGLMEKNNELAASMLSELIRNTDEARNIRDEIEDLELGMGE